MSNTNITDARIFARINDLRACARLPLDSATSEAHRHAMISARILVRVADGETIDSAFDAVLGNGTRDAVVAALYTALRAKATA